MKNVFQLVNFPADVSTKEMSRFHPENVRKQEKSFKVQLKKIEYHEKVKFYFVTSEIKSLRRRYFNDYGLKNKNKKYSSENQNIT